MTSLDIALATVIGGHEKAALVPAANVAVLWDGDLTTYEHGAEAETLFQAASISKPVAAVAALRLVASGGLDLDEDVNAYLRSWKLPKPEAWPVNVTLRHLLSHGGALTQHGFPGYPVGAPVPSLVEILDAGGVANSVPVRVDGIPGLAWRYSGGGYQILQLLLEDVTNVPYAELVDELVFKPVGMTTAGFGRPEAGAAAIAHIGGSPVDGGWHVYPEQAAAGMWCTPVDLVKFLDAVRRAAMEPGGILPRDLAVRALTEQVPGWGLGFAVDRDPRLDRFGHSGENHGYTCLALASVTGGYAAALMTNADAGRHLQDPVFEAVMDAIGWPRSPLGRGGDDKPGRPDTATFADWGRMYGGEYRTETGVVLTVGVEGEAPYLDVAGQPRLPLSLVRDDLLLTTVMPAEVSFDFDEDWNVTGLTLRQFGVDVKARR